MISADDRRITAGHLRRRAVIYVRQSSRRQVREHMESTRIQLNLREKAIGLGWANPTVVEDDLGVSAIGFAERAGFQRLLTSVTLREAGIIFCLEASRLSRNSRDWAHLFELCGYFNVLVADLDQIYDLGNPNDRLVLGIKGTVAEMEIRTLNTRLLGAIESKAERGDLHLFLPAGYQYDSDGRIAFDPDKRVQKAVEGFFERFERFTSVRQLTLWYEETKTLFPVKDLGKGSRVRWVVPNSRILNRALVHPVYAGAYVYGRHETKVQFLDGKLVKRKHLKKELKESKVLIRDHHPGYITWDQLLANREKIAENRARWSMRQNRGAIREGEALLAGMLRCARCGRQIYVTYPSSVARYACDRGGEKNTQRCMSFSSRSIESAVSDEVCRALAPLAIEAAVAAETIRREQRESEIKEARLQLQAAQYEADRALEQFDRCDPKNRLVADTLEERLNGKLGHVEACRRKIEDLSKDDGSLSAKGRERLQKLASAFSGVWRSTRVDPKTRKRILRAAIHEILVLEDRENGRLEVTIHWQGGVHTRLNIPRAMAQRGSAAGPLVERVKRLAGTLSDGEITRILNMEGITTLSGLGWNESRVKSFRNRFGVPMCPREGTSEHFSMKQARKHLGISHNALSALVRAGVISTNQVEPLAPWRVSRQELDSERVQAMVRVLKATGRLPRGGCPDGQRELFDEKP